jgi:hypothetical protein
VRSVGDNKAPETWPFSMEFVLEGEPEGYEWRRERGSLHPVQMGAGGCTQLAPERHLLVWLEDWAVRLLCGKS